MLVKNTGQKAIGFGTLVLPPDAVNTLPEGYGPEHPTVKFYLSKKWLVEVTDEVSAKEPEHVPGMTEEEKVIPESAQNEPPDLTEEEKAEMEAAAQKKAEINAKINAIGRMNLEQLRTEATSLGLEWAVNDTKSVIQQKIAEKLQAELPKG